MADWGFVDLQVNGYAGINFSCADLRREQVDLVVEMLAAEGTTAFCATVITSAPEVYEHALPILADACRELPALLGIHLEGPFISSLDGAVGTHPKQFVQQPSIPSFRRMQELADGQVRLLTVAPERCGAVELVEYAAGGGVTVGVGHTMADAEAVRAACAAGASLSTHLGNGAPEMVHRHDNPILAQLASPLKAMMITDGQHLPATFIRSVLAIKGPDNVIVTSDCAPVAGLPPGEYEFFGARIRVDEQGYVRNLDTGTLAGSSATMRDCADYLAGIVDITEGDLRRMTRDNPLAALGGG